MIVSHYAQISSEGDFLKEIYGGDFMNGSTTTNESQLPGGYQWQARRMRRTSGRLLGEGNGRFPSPPCANVASNPTVLRRYASDPATHALAHRE